MSRRQFRVSLVVLLVAIVPAALLLSQRRPSRRLDPGPESIDDLGQLAAEHGMHLVSGRADGRLEPGYPIFLCTDDATPVDPARLLRLTTRDLGTTAWHGRVRFAPLGQHAEAAAGELQWGRYAVMGDPALIARLMAR
jgi:hypothetical protein